MGYVYNRFVGAGIVLRCGTLRLSGQKAMIYFRSARLGTLEAEPLRILLLHLFFFLFLVKKRGL